MKTLTVVSSLMLLLFAAPALATTPAPKKADAPKQAKPAKADARKAAPAPRAATKTAPAAKPAPATKAAAKKQTVRYNVFYKGKRVGYSLRTEERANNKIVVRTKTDFTVRFLYFFKTRVQSVGHNVYDSKGKLVMFRAQSIVRKRKMKLWGKLTKKGLVVHRKQGKAKQETKTYKGKDYDSTSLAFRALAKLVGVKQVKRKLLMVAQQKVVAQEITVQKLKAKTVFGKHQPLFQLTVKTAGKKGSLVVAADGRMVEASMGRKIKIKLDKVL